MLLYAPRRGLLELWPLPYGQRIGALNIGTGCCLRQHITYTQPKATNTVSDGDVRSYVFRADGSVSDVCVLPAFQPQTENKTHEDTKQTDKERDRKHRETADDIQAKKMNELLLTVNAW